MKITNIFRAKGVRNYEHTRFMRTLEGRNEEVIGTSGRPDETITLVPMRTLSLEGFSYPFSSPAKIRTALQLQVQPYQAGGDVELFPVVLSRSGRSSEGIVWYTSSGELSEHRSSKVKHWPAPLPFVSGLSDYDGNGITMWLDEENVCTLLWQGYRPELYRWRKRNHEAEDGELSWYEAYCEARGLERGGTFIVDITSGMDLSGSEEFRRIIAESVKLCPWLEGLNISRTALEGERDLERTVGVMTKIAFGLAVLGVIALATNTFRLYSAQAQLESVRKRSSDLYREVFDPSRTGTISNPVALARDKIASITGTNTQSHPLEEVLTDIGEIFTSSNTQSSDITLDVIRYNSEGIDCTGSAPDMTTILNYRNAWEQMGASAQVDNTQLVSGIGYRFDLRVRWK